MASGLYEGAWKILRESIEECQRKNVHRLGVQYLLAEMDRIETTLRKEAKAYQAEIRKEPLIAREKECPHIIRKSAGDESFDYCELTEKVSGRIHPCELESGGECETWNEIKEERK